MTRRPLLLLLLLNGVLLLTGCSPQGDDQDAQPDAAARDTAATQGDGAATLEQVPRIHQQLDASVVAVLVRGGQGQGQGSGVVWDEGTIVTNAHVIQGADYIVVALASGEQIPATARAADERTDLAVLDVEHDDLRPARFADDQPAIGSLAVAMGNPLGFENSITAGIVSGLDRSIPSGGQTPALVGLIQTDAAISPGNSGGALANAQGEVIGINVAFIPPELRAVAIGFAIPSTVVRDVVEQLLEDGQVRHAMLGVQLRPLTPGLAEQLGLHADNGALVAGVESGSPADDAGLQAGDVIVEVAGQRVDRVEDVLAAIRQRSPGEELELAYMRRGAQEEATVTLGERPAD